MRVAQWLAERAGTLLNQAVERMPAAGHDWGRAVAAELAAVPPGWQRLRWSVGALWFVWRYRRRAGDTAVGRTAPDGTWSRRAFVLAGVVLVAPWLLVSILSLAETDAPDLAWEYALLAVVSQAAVLAAFLANWWPARASRTALLVAVTGYPVAMAVTASDQGEPLLAALIFGIPPALAAVPILLRSRPAATPPAPQHR